MTLEPNHNCAIREEIAERLKASLAPEPPNVSPYLDRLLGRFRELDHDASPSIVPDEDPAVERPEPASPHGWLQRLRDFTRRS
jgi:hypothetical protein